MARHLAPLRDVAFVVEDIDAVVSALRARGAELGELERHENSYRPLLRQRAIIVELAEKIG